MDKERVIDLDTARSARNEAKKNNPKIKFNGKTYDLPNELPWMIVESAASQDSNQIINSLKSLLGEQWDEFVKSGVSVADMTVLLENIATVYAIDPGN